MCRVWYNNAIGMCRVWYNNAIGMCLLIHLLAATGREASASGPGFFSRLFKRGASKKKGKSKKATAAESTAVPEKKKEAKKIKVPKATTSVAALLLGSLSESVTVMDSGPVECERCQSLISAVSQIQMTVGKDGIVDRAVWNW